jgi:hypothetical protein
VCKRLRERRLRGYNETFYGVGDGAFKYHLVDCSEV